MMKATLGGKTALITGAAKRIGRAAALALAEEGVNVVIHYRHSAEEAEELCRELSEHGVTGWAVQADFARQEDYENLVEQAVAAAGSLDILINNVSIFQADTLQNITFEGLTAVMEVNAWVPLVLSRSFAKLARRGRIVNLLDTRIKGQDRAHVSYILSKQVLAAVTEMLALELAPGITVNAVAPGLILPPPGKDEDYLEGIKDTVPLRRHGAPEDVAGAIVFLAKSDFMTGQVVYVDGGRHQKEYPGGPHPH